MDNSVELNRLKGRPRKKPIEESSSNEATKALVKMPKGRPRKGPREESPSNEATAEISSKRPKGRPRKKPIEESPSNEATKEILALVNEATKENLAQVKRPRGQPRKNPTNDTLDNLDSSNQYVQALAIEYPQDSPGLLAIEGISQNILDEAKQKRKVKEQKNFTKKLSDCNSNLKTTAQSRRLKSKARKGSNYDGVACPLLLTHNEDDNVSLDINSTSTVNYQTHENSGLNTAMLAYGSDNVSLDINSTSSIPKDADLARVVLCLAHNEKVAWDVKWRPCNAPHSKYQHCMGYLAVLLGNRSLEAADGTVCRFQLTTKVVEKDPSKHRAPHFACGSLSEDESAIVVGTPLPDGPLPLKRLVNDVGNNPKSKQPLSVSNKAEKIPTSDDQPLALCYGDDPGMYDGSDETLTASKRKKKPKSKSGSKKQEGEDQALTCIEQDDKQKGRGKDGAGNVI